MPTWNDYRLRWNISTDNVAVAYYKVYKDGVYDATIGHVLHPTNQAYLGSTPPPWCMAVTAVDTSGNESALSSPCVQFTDVFNPTLPSGLVATLITATTFTLSWNAADDNIGVVQHIVLKNSVPYATIGNVLTLDIVGQIGGTSSDWSVTAQDAAGNSSGVSTALNVTQSSAAPPVPTGLSGIPKTGYNALTWDDMSGADEYQIWSGTLLGGLTYLDATSVSNYQAIDYDPGVKRSYAVKSVSVGWESDLCTAISLVNNSLPEI